MSGEESRDLPLQILEGALRRMEREIEGWRSVAQHHAEESEKAHEQADASVANILRIKAGIEKLKGGA